MLSSEANIRRAITNVHRALGVQPMLQNVRIRVVPCGDGKGEQRTLDKKTGTPLSRGPWVKHCDCFCGSPDHAFIDREVD
jgi:hypothetical protein